jgi:hypothetical protein
MDISQVFPKEETEEAEEASFIPSIPVHIKTELLVR